VRLLKRPSCPPGGLRVSSETRHLDHQDSGLRSASLKKASQSSQCPRRNAKLDSAQISLPRDHYWCRYSCAYRITLLAASFAGPLLIDFSIAGTAPLFNPLHRTHDTASARPSNNLHLRFQFPFVNEYAVTTCGIRGTFATLPLITSLHRFDSNLFETRQSADPDLKPNSRKTSDLHCATDDCLYR
jgi:hypothetical protein